MDRLLCRVRSQGRRGPRQGHRALTEVGGQKAFLYACPGWPAMGAAPLAPAAARLRRARFLVVALTGHIGASTRACDSVLAVGPMARTRA